MSRASVKIEVYNCLNGQFYSGQGVGEMSQERFLHLHVDMGVSLGGFLLLSENMQKTYEQKDS